MARNLSALKLLLLVACQLFCLTLADHQFAKAPKRAETVVSERIVGGVLGDITRYKFLVNLREWGRFFCGGSLINSLHVLTAAHCLVDSTASGLTVHAGSSTLSSQGMVRSAARIIVNPNYNPNTMAFDVGIIRLSSAMTGTNVAYIPLATRAVTTSDNLLIAGWGLTSEGATSVPNNVRQAIVKLIPKATCSRQYLNTITIGPTMLCAAILGQRDSCSGDSGGPLVLKVANQRDTLSGIVSFGVGCARSAYSGVYTDVMNANVRSFIINNSK